ncbi:uncharacterized protein PGTG_02499 [Puccinia graminis f. sp. tritici CRL 75-36-700-3]|uniref:Uncharacterized protein n=1 Tax=Puccinia graminis f. sp. tritici (strain CRL 75-36-700-3 / race SCCL) TaxID=418459 RepID=E3JVI3_PUCGT|nr:uncharacterized protein PGTG_02499 [Puccinia graminis f. sp. tritici CRL 75-36-700-3]EFP76058.1 hypothetical protein PGTG_02499 [Puccinia graminis f. sp. tritici CRL 75-36-700-3]
MAVAQRSGPFFAAHTRSVSGVVAEFRYATLIANSDSAALRYTNRYGNSRSQRPESVTHKDTSILRPVESGRRILSPAWLENVKVALKSIKKGRPRMIDMANNPKDKSKAVDLQAVLIPRSNLTFGGALVDLGGNDAGAGSGSARLGGSSAEESAPKSAGVRSNNSASTSMSSASTLALGTVAFLVGRLAAVGGVTFQGFMPLPSWIRSIGSRKRLR